MSTPDATSYSPVTRRDFLAAGSWSFVGLSVAEQTALRRARERSGERSCILMVMAGGPSQLESFDPKPDAPREYRGPLRAISTALPGVCFSEAFPRLAEQAGHLTVVRTLHHDAAPIHETGLQLLQTGGLVSRERTPPSAGALVARLLGPRGNSPPYIVLPRRLSATGIEMYRGDGAGSLGQAFEPVTPPDGAMPADHESPARWPALNRFDDAPAATRDFYGDSTAGKLLFQARQLVEAGVRFVTVHTHDALRGRLTWDAHAEPQTAPATLYDYGNSLGPEWDRAIAALLVDLLQRGLLSETLVVCVGEMGRTPRINERGGRDHWTLCWSGLLAGGGLAGGQVIGTSDSRAAEPVESPIALSQVAATILDRLRVDVGPGTLAERSALERADAAPLPTAIA